MHNIMLMSRESKSFAGGHSSGLEAGALVPRSVPLLLGSQGLQTSCWPQDATLNPYCATICGQMLWSLSVTGHAFGPQVLPVFF